MLRNTFCHIPGIGLKTERHLWSKHVYSWEDVVDGAAINVRGCAKEYLEARIKDSLEHLHNRNAEYFAKVLPPTETWRLYGEFRHSAAFLDIETAVGGGLGNYITTIALYDGAFLRYYVNGHNLGNFAKDISQYKLLVTFNGKSFDVPIIERYFGIKLSRAHIDLRHLLAGLGYKGGLKGCEKQLGLHRQELDGVNGYFAVLLWRDYLTNGNHRALDTLLAYNILDAVNLEPLMTTAYNLKLEDTPFRDTLRLSAPVPPENPFRPDVETLDKIRSFLAER